MGVVVGIDIGSVSTKCVLLNCDGQEVARDVIPSGVDFRKAALSCLTHALEQGNLGMDDVYYSVSTGYGRERADFVDRTMSEITCHTRGAQSLLPDVRTVIDIGGQDSKVISLDGRGRVVNFAMNDKCAAGTGRFLEVMAKALETDVTQLGKLSLMAKNKLHISSTCTVFAESEVISHLATGHHREDIIAGIHESIAARVEELVRRIGLHEPVMMTGGVAKNAGVVANLENNLGCKLAVLDDPQIVGALGAALLAFDLQNRS